MTDIRDITTYDPDTGEIKWAEKPGDHAWNGLRAGRVCMATVREGTRGGVIDGKWVTALHVAALHTLGRDLYDYERVTAKNGDRTDARRENVLIATPKQVAVERSKKAKGVSYDKGSGRWVARIIVDGDRKFLGRFDTEAEAMKARAEAVREYWE